MFATLPSSREHGWRISGITTSVAENGLDPRGHVPGPKEGNKMLPSPARLTRLLIATVAALAAVAGAAGSADGATFPISKCGNKLCLDMTRSPASGVVSSGGIATYGVLVRSSSTSTATKVTLTMTFPGGANVLRQAGPRTCTEVSGAASDEVVLACDLGSVKPSPTALSFTFDVQLSQAGPTTARISSDARNSDKPGSDPTPEDFSVSDTDLSVDATDGQAASAVPKGLRFALDTDIDGSGTNAVSDERTAKFTLAANTFATTAVIQDEVDDPGFVCPPGLKCPTGGWTQAVIPGPSGDPLLIQDPGPFMPPNEMHIELVYDVSTLPLNLTERNYVLLHDRDYNPGTKNYEQIDQHCTGGNPQPPCLEDVDFVDGGDLYVKALVDGNWRYR